MLGKANLHNSEYCEGHTALNDTAAGYRGGFGGGGGGIYL